MSKRVGLLVTGRCEQLGLPAALAKAFGHRADVTFQALGEYASFTSEDVSIGALRGIPANGRRGPVEKLARALVHEGVHGTCDLAIAIDDLELVNHGRASDVRGFFADAIEREAADLTIPERERVAKRCSFHLLAPMVESYFFGERAGIDRALAAAHSLSTPPWSICGATLEDFATDDSAYVDRALAADLSKKDRADKNLAWRAANRERHPKHYLEFLCRYTPFGYREGKSGVAALEELAFADVIAAGAPMLEAMLADIEDALELPADFDGMVVPSRGILRNL
jgi:hypothetical protein